VRDGLFEPAHARLIHLIASLCPGAALRALRAPLRSRLAAHMQPAGPADKAEHAIVAEAAAGLVASGAPFLAAGADGAASPAPMDADGPAAAAGGGEGGEWVVALLRSGLAGCSLEMSSSWAAATRYSLDHLMPVAGAAPAANGGDDDDDGAAAAAGAAAAPAAPSADPAAAAAAARGMRAVFSALLAVPGGGAGAPLLLELKRLRLFEQAAASVRAYEPDPDGIGAAAAAPASGHRRRRGGGEAAAAAAHTWCFAGRGWHGWRAGVGGTIGAAGAADAAAALAGGGGGGGGGGAGPFLSAFRPPKEARGFLAGVIGEVARLMDAREQPSAVQARFGAAWRAL
jgi:hypothetical protein